MKFRLKRLLWTWCLIGALACVGKKSPTPVDPNHPTQTTPPSGKSSFKTPINGAGGPGGTAQGGAADSGAAAPGASNSASGSSSGGSSQPTRMVEESDIFKQVGNTLYVLNHYRGLEVIDLSDLDHPKVIGRAPIYGYPIEMYVEGTNAYAIVSDYYDFWAEGDGVAAFHGSQVQVIDISNPQKPMVVNTVNVDGNVTDSRIVGNIMYLVSTRYSWWDDPASSDDTTETLILSIDVSDPMNVHAVETQKFQQGSWQQNLYVTTEAPFGIYVATVDWDYNSEVYSTSIQYVDISAPTGHIVLRGQFQVPGQVQDRWSMSEYNGAFRVASGQSWGNGDVYLTTWSVTNPDNITQLGHYTLNVAESLKSAAFDGTHGYLVSARNYDPLYSFDLTDPANPVLLGSLTMSGWLDFMVPQGDRIVALGHDQTVDANGNTTTSLAVSLIDSTSGLVPKLLSRVGVGANWGWIPSSPDDYAKVFKVLPSGLILLPFQSWDATTYQYVGGVQIIDYSTSALSLRGLITGAGDVERGIPEDDKTVLTLSDDTFQVMDITNQDHPTVRARLELSRDVQDFQLLANGYAVQLSGDWYSGDTTLAVTTATDPDSASPVSEVHVPAPYGRMFVNGNFAYVVSVQYTYGQNATSTTTVQVVDFTDPTNPKVRGSMALPQPVYPGYHYWYWGYGDETVLVNGTTLAFHQYSYDWWYECDGCAGGSQGTMPNHTIYLVDLSNPDAPVLASTTTFNTVSWAWGMKASGSKLNLSTYVAELDGDQYYATYYLQQIDISDIHSPKVLPPVNIPGMFLDFAPSGDIFYTVEQTWDYAASQEHTYLHVLQLYNGAAYEQGVVEVSGYIDNVQLSGTTAFMGTGYEEQVNNSWTYKEELIAADLSQPSNPKVVSTTVLPVNYGYLQAVSGSRAFFGTDSGILTYDISNPAAPSFGAFYRTQGWSDELIVEGNTLYVPSGSYGVHVIQL